MRSLDCPRVWIAASALLVIFTLWMFLKPIEGGLGEWLNFPHSDKVLHLLAFLGLTGWFASLFETRQWRSLAVLLLAYGILVEVAQGMMGFARDADAKDVIADGAGIIVGLIAAQMFGARLLTIIDRWLKRSVG